MSQWDDAKGKLVSDGFPQMSMGDVGEARSSREWRLSNLKDAHHLEGKKKHSTIVSVKHAKIDNFDVEYHASFCTACKMFTRKTGTIYSGYLGKAFVQDFTWPDE